LNLKWLSAVDSPDHTTLVGAGKAAGRVEILKRPGPFTVFAPTNEAFQKPPAGTIENLLQPENLENKDAWTKVLTCHVVRGRLSASELKKKYKLGTGKRRLGQ